MPRSNTAHRSEELQRLGVQIRRYRKAKNMSQQELGRRMVPTMTHAAVSDAERGISNAGLLRLRQFAAALGVRVGELLIQPQQAASVVAAPDSPIGTINLSREELDELLAHWGFEAGSLAEPGEAVVLPGNWFRMREALPAVGDALVGEGCYE